ncbi:MAG: glutathione S-transferase family protein, partial [Kiloniellales bacterium]|nr:glutathione S-transferase family protein [Kiloniellales bacterium]
MGLLIEGVWHDRWYDTKSSKGEFIREDAQFRNWITKDGSAGPSGEGGFAAEDGRYHLYVSLACPWAHRTLIFRKLKGLEEIISLSVVEPLMLEYGWTFSEGEVMKGRNGETPLRFLHEVYTHAKADYSGRVTVPVLWDKKRETIVSNESSEIIRMLNQAFNDLTGNREDYYPDALREGIDEINAMVYSKVNNGVYRAGFATTQAAYEKAFDDLFAALDRLEERLSRGRYLLGDAITEADWRLFTTLVRFDPVYH